MYSECDLYNLIIIINAIMYFLYQMIQYHDSFDWLDRDKTVQKRKRMLE